MQPKQRQQLIIAAIVSEVVVFLILISTGLWGAAVLILLMEALAAAVFFLRRTGRWPRGAGTSRPRRWLVPGLLALLVLILVLTVGVQLYTDWLWFSEVGYTTVFTTRLLTQVLLFLGVAALVTLFLGGSMALALRWLPRVDRLDEQRATREHFWRRRAGPVITWLVAAGIGVIFGASAQGRWMDVQRFLHGGAVGRTDPLFNIDLGFYLFQLNLLGDIKNALLWLTVLAFLLTALVYGVGMLRRALLPVPLAHLSGLGVLFLLVMFWHYRLDIFYLVYSQGGAAYGAGFTDVNARWPAYNILSAIVLLCAALLLFNLARRSWRLLAIGAGLWLVSIIVVGAIYPALVQAFRVKPSELDTERPYISYSIDSTLQAYSLQDVEQETFPLTGTLTVGSVEQNTGTIGNIRLWDHRPLGDTYQQLQALRPYYDFKDIDVERYTLAGEYREVELSVRELSVDRLAERAQTWQNRHIVYTHGYGVVLSPVNEVCGEGQPCFLMRDIPPQTAYAELKLDRPEIYFGEDTDNYVIVGTTAQEFDYPIGDQNAQTTYQGTGGIPTGDLFRRLAFALRFGDLSLLVSEYLTPESRLLFHRSIQDRVQTVAPFLGYDYDPYPVILDGRLYWVQDAYTLSDMYPYSQPFDDPYGEMEQFYGYNYFRNSVKVVIDAYNGTTTFYIVDPTDPLVQAYAAIFPGLFHSEEMPAGLRAHWRYPEQLFRIQSYIYAVYHMRDPQVFYNKEDAWVFAKETYEEQTRPIDSYYVIMKLPGWEREEFFLMVPFTPASRDNMIAWMHVQCDGADYGKLGIFKFPKQTLVYGPLQIEARLNQDPLISQQLTLWGQRGSSVIRGNLIVVPIDHNLLYVAPIYLQAQTGQIPELQRVIVAYGDRIVMAETLDTALRQVLAGSPTAPPVEERAWEEVARAAQEHYQRAQECLKTGDWACYGTEMQALEQDLQELVRLTEGK
jgi:uncharacterized membrane protein (UPF0182 family)